MDISVTDILSITIIILGLWTSISTIIYLFKLRKFSVWWIDAITIIGSLYVAILFSLVLFRVFPSGSPPAYLGRPVTILLLTSILCNILYSRGAMKK